MIIKASDQNSIYLGALVWSVWFDQCLSCERKKRNSHLLSFFAVTDTDRVLQSFTHKTFQNNYFQMLIDVMVVCEIGRRFLCLFCFSLFPLFHSLFVTRILLHSSSGSLSPSALICIRSSSLAAPSIRPTERPSVRPWRRLRSPPPPFLSPRRPPPCRPTRTPIPEISASRGS